MKKQLLATIVLFCSIALSQRTYAQEDLGIRKFSSIGFMFAEYRNGIVHTQEFGIKNIPLTIGYRNTASYNFDAKFFSSFNGLVLNYHFSQHIPAIKEKLDLYAGGTYGANIFLAFYDTIEFEYYTQPFVQAGARYFFTPGFGVYAQGNLSLKNTEFVSGNSFEIGITLRKK